MILQFEKFVIYRPQKEVINLKHILILPKFLNEAYVSQMSESMNSNFKNVLTTPYLLYSTSRKSSFQWWIVFALNILFIIKTYSIFSNQIRNSGLSILSNLVNTKYSIIGIDRKQMVKEKKNIQSAFCFTNGLSRLYKMVNWKRHSVHP